MSDELARRIASIEKTLHGNGQPGLIRDVSMVRGDVVTIEKSLNTMTETMAELETFGTEVKTAKRILLWQLGLTLALLGPVFVMVFTRFLFGWGLE